MYALVTGASSGIGREISKLLAQRKFDLIIAARREDRLIELKEFLEGKYGIHVLVKVCDLSLPDNAEKLYEDCLEYDVGAVVNNAGFGKIGGFDKIPLKDEISMINTNITALHILTKLFSSKMESGYILNVASMAGFLAGPKMAAYAATKAYVISLSRAVNYEMKKCRKNVSVSALCPGPVDTEFNSVANAHFSVKALDAKTCAKIAVKGMFRKKPVIITGMLMKAARLFSKILPHSLLLPAVYKIQDGKTKKNKLSD